MALGPLRIISALCYFAARQDHCPTARGHGAFRRHALAACEPQAPGGVYREARSGEAAAETERNQRGEGGKPMAGLCLRRFVRWARCSYLRTARAWRGGFREARSGDAVAETERAQCGKGGKPMAGLCLRRFVRLLRCSDGAGLAGFIASAVTERSSCQWWGKQLAVAQRGAAVIPLKNKAA